MGAACVAVTSLVVPWNAGLRGELRVFGCDIETALLNHVKRSAGFPGRCKQIVGQYVAMAFKKPCPDTYTLQGSTE